MTNGLVHCTSLPFLVLLVINGQTSPKRGPKYFSRLPRDSNNFRQLLACVKAESSRNNL